MKTSQNGRNNKIIDVDTIKSERKGITGLVEKALRKFRIISFVFALIPVYLIGILVMGISLLPGIYFFKYIYTSSQTWIEPIHFAAIGIAIVCGYFLYGFSIIFVAPLFNFLLPFRLKPFRGPYFSWQSVPWFFHNSLVYLVRYTFLEFITPTPFNILFYKMMGMKIGKGVHINTTNISDVALIEMEDKVTIGGSAHIICHYAAKGYLVIEPVKIKRGATVGLKATVMGDVVIGEGATIAPHEVVMPKSRIPAGYKPRKQSKIE